jgi:hypothetical protein
MNISYLEVTQGGGIDGFQWQVFEAGVYDQNRNINLIVTGDSKMDLWKSLV